jgi:hypothetical protein
MMLWYHEAAEEELLNKVGYLKLQAQGLGPLIAFEYALGCAMLREFGLMLIFSYRALCGNSGAGG